MGISDNMATRHNVAKVVNIIHAKLTFGKFTLHLMVLQFAKDPVQMLYIEIYLLYKVIYS